MLISLYFFHPDYTVGTGISPAQLLHAGSSASCRITAGGESHPAPKLWNKYRSGNLTCQDGIHFSLDIYFNCYVEYVRFVQSIGGAA
jgi:hypothetical protein